jgi:hypothetical protein
LNELVTTACRNCGASASGNYCPECGQETAPHPPTAGEFLHEFVGHYIALEGALWRTLRQLVVPGRLTNEYFAGRKRRYVLPLRLYLTASIVFFLVAKVIVPHPDPALIPGGAAATGAPGAEVKCPAGNVPCAKINKYLQERYGNVPRREFIENMLARLVNLAPYAMFFLLPIFALLTRLAYWNRPRNYGEHLVFALHVHAFGFLLAALVAPLRVPMLASIPVAIYLAAALSSVFGGRAWAKVLRFLFVFISYFAIVTLVMSGLAMAVIFL